MGCAGFHYLYLGLLTDLNFIPLNNLSSLIFKTASFGFIPFYLIQGEPINLENKILFKLQSSVE